MRSVLVLDDSVELAESIGNQLSQSDYSVELAYTLKEAREKLALHAAVGCILSDYHLPDGNGLELFHQRRAQGEFTPFILMSGGFRPLIEDLRALEAFLEKPFAIERLLVILERVFARASNPATPADL